MQNDDLTSIKYLMKELDPAEAVLFEQRMMEDEELLEEVECMRRTMRRLEKLPVKNPPSELTEYIVRKACAGNCSSRFYHWWSGADEFSMTRYYAAAALILVGMGIGLLSYQYTDKESRATNGKKSVSTAEFGSGSSLFKSGNSPSSLMGNTNMLYLDNQDNEQSVPNNSIVDSSRKKDFDHFRPISPPINNKRNSLSSGNVRLTGSHR